MNGHNTIWLINYTNSTNSSEVSVTLFLIMKQKYSCKKIVIFTFIDLNVLRDDMEDCVECVATQEGIKQIFMAKKHD